MLRYFYCTSLQRFLIIKNDSIWHESYFDGYTTTSKSNSFSIAKSIVSAALGKAIMEGKIKSLDQKVTDFFPKLKGKFANEVTVGDLSSMASGLSWDEKYYSPFSIVTREYFDDHLKEVIFCCFHFIFKITSPVTLQPKSSFYPDKFELHNLSFKI